MITIINVCVVASMEKVKGYWVMYEGHDDMRSSYEQLSNVLRRATNHERLFCDIYYFLRKISYKRRNVYQDLGSLRNWGKGGNILLVRNFPE